MNMNSTSVETSSRGASRPRLGEGGAHVVGRRTPLNRFNRECNI